MLLLYFVYKKEFLIEAVKNIQSYGKTGEEQAKRLKYLNKRATTTVFDVGSSVLLGEM